jgi:hypothetical protein
MNLLYSPMITVCLLAWTTCAAEVTAPPVYQAPAPAQPAAQAVPATAAPAAAPAPPPSAPAKRSAADLDKLAQPIALHPDPLIAILLPASVYPVEIVQAARFVKDTNNVPKVDQQPWDENVKAVAKVPALIAQMDADLNWTVQLGQAFLDQPKELMDAIQALRAKAQKAGTLQTTPQQVVIVTNVVVEKTVEQRVVVVTNTVVQIQPSNPQLVYVPSYPSTVYYPPPGYVYNPWAPLVTFGVGMAWGAILANNCDWHHGGVWCGGSYHSDVNVNVNNNFNQNVNVNNRPGSGSGTRPSNPGSGNRPPGATSPGGRPPSASTLPAQQKWQPDQNRMRSSGAGGPSAGTMEARGWGSGATRPSTQPAGAARPTPSTGAVGARPSTGAGGAGPSTGAVGARPSTGTPSASRPSASPTPSRPASSPSVNRSAPSAAARDSAFSGAGGGGNTRDFSSRGSGSRSSGGFSGSRGGGGRGGGGGGGRR